MKIYFLRHFQTEVNPEEPVSKWDLSREGFENLEKFIDNRVLDIDAVITSSESKSMNPGIKIAETWDVAHKPTKMLDEVDRSGEGFIEEHSKYIEMVNDYLSRDSVDFDWEPKSSVNQRISKFLDYMENSDYDKVLVLGHGLYFSVLLGDSQPGFWRNLTFGELIRRDLEELR